MSHSSPKMPSVTVKAHPSAKTSPPMNGMCSRARRTSQTNLPLPDARRAPTGRVSARAASRVHGLPFALPSPPICSTKQLHISQAHPFTPFSSRLLFHMNKPSPNPFRTGINAFSSPIPVFRSQNHPSLSLLSGSGVSLKPRVVLSAKTSQAAFVCYSNPMQSDDAKRLDALTTAFNHLLQNQDLLQKRIAHLENLLQTQPETTPQEPLRTSQPSPALEDSLPIAPEPISTVEPVLAGQTTPSREPALKSKGFESKVGLTLVNRIGAITLVLGVAFFFKWAVDNNWIGPAGRVILGLLAGFATLAAGDFIWRKRQQVFAQGITATGIAIVYLSLYAAFAFYRLIPQSAAFLLMVAATAMAAVLALRYKSFAIAALGSAGAYATPLLLSTGQDHPWFLFSYLLLLNFAATELAKRGAWPKLEIVSFVATVLIYGAWLFDRGTQPEKRLVATLAPLAFTTQRWRTQTPLLFAFAQFLTACALCLIWKPEDPVFLPLALLVAAAGLAFAHTRSFQFATLSAFAGFWFEYSTDFMGTHEPLTSFLGVTCGFVLFVLWSYWRLVLRRSVPTTLALSVLALNGVIYYVDSYRLLQPHYHSWLGPLAAFVAAVYLAFGLFFHRQTSASGVDHRPVLLALGMALTFLTLAIPIQFTGFTITIAWAIQGAALTWIASRLNSTNAFIGALLVFALVALRLFVFEAETLPDPASYSLLWNSRFLTFAASAVAMLLASYWASKILPPAALANYFAGHFFLLWGLCLEILGWAARSATPPDRLSVETIAISTLFGVYAVILVSAGVATRTTINRLSGLGLIGIVVLKLYLFDVWQLGRPYQIAAFVILGILLLSTSFLYSHFRRLIETWWKDDQTSA